MPNLTTEQYKSQGLPQGSTILTSPSQIKDFNILGQVGATGAKGSFLFGTPKVPSSFDATKVGATPAMTPLPLTVPPDNGLSFVSSITPTIEAANTSYNSAVTNADKLTAPIEAEKSTLTTRLTEALSSLTGKGTALTAAESKLGVPDQVKQIQELNTQIAQRKGEFEKSIAAVEQGASGRNISVGSVTGQQGALQRAEASQIGALTSVMQAAQGNLALSQQTAQKAVDLEFADKQQEVDNLKTLLELNQTNLTSAEKKRAETLAVALEEKQNIIDTAKEERKQVLSLTASAAQQGADNSTLMKMTQARTAEEAMQIGGSFLGAEFRQKAEQQEFDNSIETQKLASERMKAGKTSGDGSGVGGTTGTGPGGALTDYDILREAVSNKLGSVAAKKSFDAQYARATTDEQRLKILANNVVLPTEIKNGIIQNSQVTRSLNDVITLLDSGVKTGLLQAGQSYIANKVGTGAEKSIETIKSKLITALQPYRNKVTGAAWGTQEEAEYQALLGSVRFSPDDLKNKLNVFNNTLTSQSQAAIMAGIDPLGATNQNSVLSSQQALMAPPLPSSATLASQQGFFAKTFNWLFGD